MVMRSMIARIPRSAAIGATTRSGCRCFSDDRGRILSEEEKAAENVYIQKMEREKMEKLKKKAEKEKAEAEKQKSEKEERNQSSLTDATWRPPYRAGHFPWHQEANNCV
ncbi:putative mitochondrial ATPase inhibitor [Dioscorea sansibarensis]